MLRRHNMLPSMLLLLVCQTTASAVDHSTTDAELRNPVPIDFSTAVRLDIRATRHPADYGWTNSIMMRWLPAGSLQYQFAGFHQFAVRHVRSQYRRFIRQASRNGWYVRDDDNYNKPLYLSPDERVFVGGFNNRAWWQRSWFESLPPERGGAPYNPYIHTHGSDESWTVGPLTITNGFNIRLRNIGFFEFNPNPVETQGAKPAPRATIDIHPPDQRTVKATDFRFNVRPHIRVGIPHGRDWKSLLRGLSLRGTMEVRRRNLPVIEGNIEVRWDPSNGLSTTLDLALLTW